MIETSSFDGTCNKMKNDVFDTLFTRLKTHRFALPSILFMRLMTMERVFILKLK